MRKDLEESSTRVCCLHKQIPFVRFLVCFRSNHYVIATPYRPIFVDRTSSHSLDSIHSFSPSGKIIDIAGLLISVAKHAQT